MKIVVVGGGSSGWIAATTLIGVPGAEVTVIESPTVPKVGVGESTIDGFIEWMNLMGINPEDMMKDTDASYKLAIKFEDFLIPGHHFYYPFGTFGIEKKYFESWSKRAFIDPERHHPFSDTFFANMALIRQKKFKKDSLSFPHNAHALHFDASKFGPWLWENYCKPRGVKRIEMDVTHIETDENGIKYLELPDGHKVEADLFIDCTGFKSLLLEGALNEPFKDYSNVLPNNMAWATHIQYIDKEKEIESFTNCTALGNGWVWNIPLWSRIGTGYVYSNKFITDDQALDEFKAHLKKGGRDPETLEYKKIHIKNGIHERIWVKNVVAIGLSAGFIEPLESTGLWFSHEFSSNLLRILFRGAPPNQHYRDSFNHICNWQWNQLVCFVGQHYALSTRQDTDYWKAVAKTSFPLEESFVKATFDQSDRFYSMWPGGNAIAAGFEHYFYDQTHFWKKVHPKNQDWKEIYKGEFDELDIARSTWWKEAEGAESFMSVLEKIHNKVFTTSLVE
jgi:tryptophan halogenase